MSRISMPQLQGNGKLALIQAVMLQEIDLYIKPMYVETRSQLPLKSLMPEIYLLQRLPTKIS